MYRERDTANLEIPPSDYERLSRALEAYAELSELLGDRKENELKEDRIRLLAVTRLADIIYCNLARLYARHKLPMLDWNVIVGMRAQSSRARLDPHMRTLWFLLKKVLPRIMPIVESTFHICKPSEQEPENNGRRGFVCKAKNDDGKYRRLFRRLSPNEREATNRSVFYPSTLSQLCQSEGSPSARRRMETELWFQQLSESHRRLLYGRLRKSDDVVHLAAYYELFFHEYFRARSFEIEVEPIVSTCKPDYLVSGHGEKFYLEVQTVWNAIDFQAGRDAVERVLSALNQLQCRYVFSVDFLEVPNAVDIEDFVSAVRRWLSSLEYECCNPAEMRVKEFGLDCMITAIPNDDLNSFGAVYRWSTPEMERDQSAHAVRGALRKDLKFAKLIDSPVVLAVCAHENASWDEIEICNQLFGDVEISAGRNSKRSVSLTHAGRGFSADKNTRISAIVFCTQRANRGRRIHDMRAFHNPWAAHPLSSAVLKDMPQLVPVRDDPTRKLEWHFPNRS